MIRAALYARVSTETQQKEGTIESQVIELKRQISAAGHVLVKEYIDDGFSGAQLDRPALEELREDLKTDLFETIYFLSTDRIARNVAHQLIIVGELLKHGKQIIINGKDYVHNPENKFTLTVLGAVAELERAKIMERMTRGKPRHSDRYLDDLLRLQGTPIRSLTPKLVARTNLRPGDAGVLVRLFLTHWDYIGDPHGGEIAARSADLYMPRLPEVVLIRRSAELADAPSSLACTTRGYDDRPSVSQGPGIVRNHCKVRFVISTDSPSTSSANSPHRWKERGGFLSSKPRHSDRYLDDLLKLQGTPIRSLTPKLVGRTNLKPADAAVLVRLFLSHWEYVGDPNSKEIAAQSADKLGDNADSQ
jgi:hypothetical protein